jgi:hypothetical protein
VISLGSEHLRYLRVHPGGIGPANVSEIRVFAGRSPESLAPVVDALAREAPIELSSPDVPMRVAVFSLPVAEGPCERRTRRVLLPAEGIPPN